METGNHELDNRLREISPNSPIRASSVLLVYLGWEVRYPSPCMVVIRERKVQVQEDTESVNLNLFLRDRIWINCTLEEFCGDFSLAEEGLYTMYYDYREKQWFSDSLFYVSIIPIPQYNCNCTNTNHLLLRPFSGGFVSMYIINRDGTVADESCAARKFSRCGSKIQAVRLCGSEIVRRDAWNNGGIRYQIKMCD